jgi:Cellulase N-terminal ig-like domain
VLTTGSHRTPGGAPAAAIRVDQVGYPAGARKQAEIMTKSKPAHALHWVMVRAGSCTVAASGLAGPGLGAWSKRYG